MLTMPAACFCWRQVMKPLCRLLLCCSTSIWSLPQGSASNMQCSWSICHITYFELKYLNLQLSVLYYYLLTGHGATFCCHLSCLPPSFITLNASNLIVVKRFQIREVLSLTPLLSRLKECSTTKHFPYLCPLSNEQLGNHQMKYLCRVVYKYIDQICII